MNWFMKFLSFTPPGVAYHLFRIASEDGKRSKVIRARNRAFDEGLPKSYPFRIGSGEDAVVRYGSGNNDFRPAVKGDESLPGHPAYEGPLANTMLASNYRRAVYGGSGPRAKDDDTVSRNAATWDRYNAYLEACRADGEEPDWRGWLAAAGIPLPMEEP